MSKLLVAVTLSLSAGFAVGSWFLYDDSNVESVPIGAILDDTNLAERVQLLEQALSEESAARRRLEEQLYALSDARVDIEPQEQRESRQADSGAAVGPGQRRQRNFSAMVQNFQTRRLNSLVTNGYSEDEAQRVLDLESAAQYQAMRKRYEAEQQGSDPFVVGVDSQSLLRESLGDAEYERFLVAQGQATSVQVINVLNGSPGASAGLQPGDEIVSYNGVRTFSMSDLRQQTMQGNPGDAAVVEIDRDGVRMQLSLPVGPIGMNGNGAAIRSARRWGG